MSSSSCRAEAFVAAAAGAVAAGAHTAAVGHEERPDEDLTATGEDAADDVVVAAVVGEAIGGNSEVAGADFAVRAEAGAPGAEEAVVGDATMALAPSCPPTAARCRLAHFASHSSDF
jgi:hypothetical protein